MEKRQLRLVNAKHHKAYYFYKIEWSEDPADNVFTEQQRATSPRDTAIKWMSKGKESDKGGLPLKLKNSWNVQPLK